MRMIGELKDAAQARTFGDYLYTQGIGNEIERERDGTFVIWVHSDDDLDRAKALLEKFKGNPTHQEFETASTAAAQKRQQEAKEFEAVEKRTFRRDRVFPGGIAPVTLTLILVSIFVFVRTFILKDEQLLSYLFIATKSGFLPEVRDGQVWRLVTPIFIHGGLLHILFNMMMLKDFGTVLERRHSGLAIGLFVVMIAVGSNLAQYISSGPRFGGMSGVVYGLFGYLWLRPKFDPDWHIELHPSSVIIILVWLLAGFMNLIPGVRVANLAHLGGLIIGGLWALGAAYGLGGRMFK